MSVLAGPARLFRAVAVAEAVTWALLLLGMVLKYVTRTTELGVQVFGMVRGVVFLAYCVTAVLVAVDQGWGVRRGVVGLLAAVPPFVTVPFERATARRGLLGDAWRLRTSQPAGPLERPVAALLRRPARAVVGGVAAVAALTVVALAVGPPA